MIEQWLCRMGAHNWKAKSKHEDGLLYHTWRCDWCMRWQGDK